MHTHTPDSPFNKKTREIEIDAQQLAAGIMEPIKSDMRKARELYDGKDSLKFDSVELEAMVNKIQEKVREIKDFKESANEQGLEEDKEKARAFELALRNYRIDLEKLEFKFRQWLRQIDGQMGSPN